MGWTEQQLADATPAYLSALRWLLFAEAIWPSDAADAQAPVPATLPPRERTERAMQRARALEMLAERRRLLNPED